MDNANLKEKIDELRDKLNNMVINNPEPIFNEETLKLSQELDILINQYIKKSSDTNF